MFGFGKKKTQSVKLTESEIKELMKNMSKSERREFERRQKRAMADQEWDFLMMADLFGDD